MSAKNQKIRRLPGFRFDARTATREDVLPRMDVALFVGFAASGPIGIPVALESTEQFTSIFGGNLPLVWDKEKGKMISAYLAPTVRMFFRNGGKRCWVIRISRIEADSINPLNRAVYNFFPLAGLAAIGFDGENSVQVSPAFARARSKGSWSDDLQIATAMLSNVVEFKSLVETDGIMVLRVSVPTNKPIEQSELLRLDFPDSDLNLIFTADSIEEDDRDFSPPDFSNAAKLKLKISSTRFVWVRDLSNVTIGTPKTVPVSQWTRQFESANEDISNSALETNEAELIFEKTAVDVVTGKRENIVRLTFDGLSSLKLPGEGNLLVTKLDEELLCLQVETVINSKSETKQITHLICKGAFVQKTAERPNSEPDVERMSFEIWVKKGKENLIKLNDLAFNADHEKFLGDLPVDDDLYSLSEDESRNSPEIPAWTQNGEFANSPVAGTGALESFYIPVFPTALIGSYLGAVRPNGSKLQRDGLEVFDENLFLDEKLRNIGLNNLLNDAEFIRYLSPKPRRLWGIHSALAPETMTVSSAGSLPTYPAYASFSLDEATIISVPDANHRGWFRNKDKGEILSSPMEFDPILRPEWWRFQDCRDPERRRVKHPPWGNFLDCDLKIIEPPENLQVDEADISDGTFTITWNYGETDKGLQFVLEESATPDFGFPQEIYRNNKMRFQVTEHGAGVFYYRVRAEIGGVISDWSDGLGVRIPTAESWTAKLLDRNEPENSERRYKTDVSLAVHRALLRICAARGDIFAVLDLPEHFDKEEAVQYVATLKTTKGLINATGQVEPFSSDEKTALSFGAVYHPWLMIRDEDYESVTNIPSSGAVCGVFAKRAADRGAWVAPANVALQNVLGLSKGFRRESFLDLQDALINLVRHEPTGFLVLDSDTLSDDPDLRQINVRRLLSLLRRLAVKHGAEYVFEPNNERFRRSVQRGFNSLLDQMFVRGAFAGVTPATSYQVVVSDKVNNFQSVDQGRFIVELRVAPSLPLRFVTVRLINSGGRSSVTETV